ncbi:POK6 protein, partial [Aramus guarauna]|nr:POK6 protein [Aramus guarauna]
MVYPQSVCLTLTINTLNDRQKLLDTLNWLRSLLGISMHDLSLLFSLLKGNLELISP